MNTSSESGPQVDWVKYAGLAAAVLIFVGSQWFVSKRLARRQLALRQQAREKAAREAENKSSAPTDEAKTNRPSGKTAGHSGVKPPVVTNVHAGEPAKPPSAKPPTGKKPPAPVPQRKKGPDITVSGENLKLVFSEQGGALRKGWLSNVKIKADTKPEDIGLQILDEIDPGKLSLGLASFTFNGQEFTALETRLWDVAENSEEFAGSDDEWTVAYRTTLRGAQDIPLCKLVKRFRVQRNARHVALELEVTNLTQQPAKYAYALRGPAGILLDGPADNPRQGAYVKIKLLLAGRGTDEDEPAVQSVFPFHPKKTPDEEKRRISAAENLWAGLSNRFFQAVMVARQPQNVIKIVGEGLRTGQRKDKRQDKRFSEPNLSPLFYRVESEPLAPGASSEPDGYALYLGPSEEDQLRAFEGALALDLDRPMHLNLAVQYCDIFGWRWPNVDRLSRLMLWIFRGIEKVTGSYGLAVILLTLLIKLCLHPIQRKASVNMHKMQMLQPKLKTIEEKYKGQTNPDVRKKKEMEKWDLMRKEGVSVHMGCLPMFFQMPLIYALYSTFRRAFEIRQAHFLWIKDLSLSDRFLTFHAWPHELNLLPLFYIAMTLAQSMMAPKPKTQDPQQETQRKVMMFMPVFFGFIFYKFSSGLVLYFAASSVFGVLESWYIKRHILKVDAHGQPLLQAGGASAKKDLAAGAKATAS